MSHIVNTDRTPQIIATNMQVKISSAEKRSGSLDRQCSITFKCCAGNVSISDSTSSDPVAMMIIRAQREILGYGVDY